MNPSTQRITAFDFARALAIFGMIIVNYKLAMQVDNDDVAWLGFITSLFEGRAAALFVMLAGIGVSLMTTRARSSLDKEVVRRSRNNLYRRAAFLFIIGMFLLLIGWTADILHYYAVFMLIAAILITASDKIILSLFTVILLTSQSFLIMFDYSKGWNSTFHVYTEFWTIEGFIRNLIFNGFHPIFPWVCFFLIGLWLGRKHWLYKGNRLRLLLYSLSGAIIFETISYGLIKGTTSVLDTVSANYLFTTKPMPPTMLYVLSATCLAVAIITISFYVVEKIGHLRLTQALINTGQLSLTHYIGHVIIGLGFLQLVSYLQNRNISFAIAYGCGYFLIAMIFSFIWRRRIARGPVEMIMRRWC